MRKRNIIDSTEKERSLGALVEDMDDKFQIILESTSAIPVMQKQLEHVLSWEDKVNLIPGMQKQLEHVLSWEDNINLIPAIFDEVGSLRTELEALKTTLGEQHPQLQNFEIRLRKIEGKIGAVS